MTTLGELVVRRHYWQCRCGADGGYAVDAVLGLDQRFSRVVQKHGCRLAADVSFAKTKDHLHELLGVSIATETVRTLVERHGKAMASFQPKDEATAESFAQAAGEVEFAVDAGKVNTREDGWKDLKMAVVSKREAGPSSTPEQWADDRLPAATIGVAFAMIAARGRLLKDGWAGVFVWVAEVLAVEDVVVRERRRPATEKLLMYFTPHKERLAYRDLLAKGRAIGSGAVEGQAKTLGLRLKARGARWRKKNVRAMVSLVFVRNSVQWNAYWQLAA